MEPFDSFARQHVWKTPRVRMMCTNCQSPVLWLLPENYAEEILCSLLKYQSLSDRTDPSIRQPTLNREIQRCSLRRKPVSTSRKPYLKLNLRPAGHRGHAHFVRCGLCQWVSSRHSTEDAGPLDLIFTIQRESMAEKMEHLRSENHKCGGQRSGERPWWPRPTVNITYVIHIQGNLLVLKWMIPVRTVSDGPGKVSHYLNLALNDPYMDGSNKSLGYLCP